MNDAVRFNCVGCGACCKGRFVPLTLNEAQQWLRRGHDVSVLLEAFDASTWAGTAAEYEHHAHRAAEVPCGAARVQVIAIFAARALPQCPNLLPDNLCNIYGERPLVCRIYPMEINPFIPLRKEHKDCPQEAWGEGEILCTDSAVDPALTELIARFRQADRDDARRKNAICEQLGLTVAAWKGTALTIYSPDRASLLRAIERSEIPLAEQHPWKIRTNQPGLRRALESIALALDTCEESDYIFHSLD